MTWISALWNGRARRDAERAKRLAEAVAEERRHPADDLMPSSRPWQPVPPLPWQEWGAYRGPVTKVSSWRQLCALLARENATLRAENATLRAHLEQPVSGVR
jgi:hypothetical protein